MATRGAANLPVRTMSWNRYAVMIWFTPTRPGILLHPIDTSINVLYAGKMSTLNQGLLSFNMVRFALCYANHCTIRALLCKSLYPSFGFKECWKDGCTCKTFWGNNKQSCHLHKNLYKDICTYFLHNHTLRKIFHQISSVINYMCGVGNDYFECTT